MNDIDKYCVAMMLYPRSTSHSISRIALCGLVALNVWITISKWSLSRSRPDSAISLASRYVQVDYHVQVQGHYYSVPYKYLKKQLDVRVRASHLGIMNLGKSYGMDRLEAARNRA